MLTKEKIKKTFDILTCADPIEEMGLYDREHPEIMSDAQPNGTTNRIIDYCC